MISGAHVDPLMRHSLALRSTGRIRNIYPDLVRVFYTNLKFEGNNLVSHVKGVEMEITHEVWIDVAGLKFSGLRINKGNLGVVEDFNKIQFYKSCLKNNHAQVSTCSVGGLKLDERLLALIVTWILTPRGSNHSVLTEEVLVYIFYITKKIKINWILILPVDLARERCLVTVFLTSLTPRALQVHTTDSLSENLKNTQWRLYGRWRSDAQVSHKNTEKTERKYAL